MCPFCLSFFLSSFNLKTFGASFVQLLQSSESKLGVTVMVIVVVAGLVAVELDGLIVRAFLDI